MEAKQKGPLIRDIIAHLRFMANTEKKAFSDGDTFFALAFRTDSELLHIAKLCGAVRPSPDKELKS